MIEFEALAMKADTNELHAIFLLKKNVRQDIIKTILGYPPIAMREERTYRQRLQKKADNEDTQDTRRRVRKRRQE